MPWEVETHLTKNDAATRGLEWDNFDVLLRKTSEYARTVPLPPAQAQIPITRFWGFYECLRSGDDVNPDHFMRVLRIKPKAKRPLPHYFSSWYNRPIVSQDWKDAIESLEPGVHQFIPIEVYDEIGTPYGRKYYYLNIKSILDAIDPDGENVYLSEGQYNRRVDRTGPIPWNLLRANYGNHHLWRQSKDGLGRERIFISDQLYKKIKMLRPQPVQFIPCSVR
ncbi:MAG: hypothetical protein IOD03_18190 [Methylocystis sp.]|jgi:hypothetical protein|nr:hypothetical protein [Methylocystis sp.]MCA3593364.1 hypothetical protein [Methylocystis sp.]